MKTRCANCGEELLGAVNRCWRCGTQIVSDPERVSLPPVRRVPQNESDQAEPAAADVVRAEAVPPSDPERRDCGPTARSVDVTPGGAAVPGDLPPRASEQRANHRRSAKVGGAIAALVLGVMSLIGSAVTPLALFPAALGVLMGLWGLYSSRRGTALFAIALCCIALAISTFQGLVHVYRVRHGYAPWQAPDERELYEETYFEQTDDL